jgi:integrase
MLPPKDTIASAYRMVDDAIRIKPAPKQYQLLAGVVSPATENRTVATPLRRPNAELRTREYLTDAEVAKLTEAAKDNRYGHRDATMILLAYRHGFRAIELVDLRWDQIDFDRATLAVRRVKKGSPCTHPLLGDEMRALRKLQREQEPKSAFVFTSGRGSPFTTAGFAPLVERAGAAAGFKFKAPPAHAPARLRLRSGQQGARYAGTAGLSRSSEYPAHGALHRVVAGSVQGLLEIG